MAELTTAPKHFCFVLMPFEDGFNDVYKIGIKDACANAGAYCERVDEQIFHESILDRIYNQIAKADLIIADMTNRNANVFYEVGYAHALGKRTVLLTKNSDDIPFDLKHFPHIIYGNSITKLRDDLTTRVKWSVENAASKGDGTFGLELFVGSQNLCEKVVVPCKTGFYPAVDIVIVNSSTTVFVEDDFHIGIVLDGDHYVRTKSRSSMEMPDGSKITMFNEFGTLFPGACTPLSFSVGRFGDNVPSLPLDVAIRVFTVAGSRDFQLRFVRADE